MATSYVEGLRRQITIESTQEQPALQARLMAWLKSLPPAIRDRPFAMQEFEAALATQGKYISAVLLDLGWTRKRQWSTTGQYHRYWLPPEHRAK